MKRLILIGFCLLFFSSGFAQTHDSLLPTRLRYEVATDLLWLIDKNNVPRTSLFFRYNLPKRMQAIRLRIGTQGKKESFKTTVDDSLLYGSSSPKIVRMYSIDIGYEWQQQLKSWQMYYGADIGYRYDVDRFILLPYTLPTGVYSSEVINKTHTFSGVGFLGARYFIHPKISVSSELQIMISYSKYKHTKQNLLSQSEIFDRSNFRTWRFLFHPIHVIQISYHF